MSLELLLSEIQDKTIREDFQRVKNFIDGSHILKANLKFLTLDHTVTSSPETFLFPHNLGYTPKDIVVTSAIGSPTYVWNYSAFDSTNLSITITGAAKLQLRFFAGTYA